MTVSAVYELPVPIWVMSAALGQRLAAGCRGVHFDLVMPQQHEPHGLPPALEGLASRPELAADVEWASDRYAGHIPDSLKPAVLLFRVGIENVTAPPPAPHRSWAGPHDQLVDVIDAWFDALRTWAEVVSGQDLDPRHRVYDAEAHGVGLTFLDPAHDGALGMTLGTSRVRPLKAAEWARIVERVRAGALPPLEEIISRDSRAAFARGSRRRAVIEAATATEIVLGRYLRAHKDRLPEAQLRRLSERSALGELISIADNAGIEFAVPLEDLRALKRLRDAAAHRGTVPTGWAGDLESLRAVQTMIDFLSAHGPYRRTATTESDGSEWIVAED